MPKRKLYALLVGVNKYQNTRPLYGCEEDVKEVHDFLTSQNEFDLDAVVLSTAAKDKTLIPTKANIINHFETHFSNAKDGDIAFFFFAGHGVREETSIPAFQQDESDGLIKTLACYDSTFKKGVGLKGSTLAGKEIRYLLHKTLGNKDVHTVFIMDSCHSEGSSRKITELESRRLGPRPIKERKYEGFCFSKEIRLKDFEKHSIDELLPLINQVQLAACRAFEEAWEARYPDGRVGGYFTMTIMELLRRSAGNITYYELRNRAANIMKGMKTASQVPQVFGGFIHPNDIYKTFLSGTPNKKPAYCNASFNEKSGWLIDLGAIHGIPVNTQKSPTPVEVFSTAKPKKIFKATVSEVFPGYCVIKFGDKAPPKDSDDIFRAKVEGAAMQPINVFVTGPNKKKAERYFETRNKKAENTYVKVVDKELAADYVLHVAKDEYFITYPSDEKPLVLQAPHTELDNRAEQVFKYFTRISQWEFIRQLHNPDTYLHRGSTSTKKMYPIELKIFQKKANGDEVTLNLDSGQAYLDLDFLSKPDFQTGRRIPFSRISFEFTNHSQKPLHCALIYLSSKFGSTPILQELLEPNRPLKTKNLKLELPKYIEDFKWDYAKDYLKLLISTSEFEGKALTLHPPLPEPVLPDIEGSRMLSFEEDDEIEDTPPKDDWTTFTIELLSKKV